MQTRQRASNRERIQDAHDDARNQHNHQDRRKGRTENGSDRWNRERQNAGQHFNGGAQIEALRTFENRPLARNQQHCRYAKSNDTEGSYCFRCHLR